MSYEQHEQKAEEIRKQREIAIGIASRLIPVALVCIGIAICGANGWSYIVLSAYVGGVAGLVGIGAFLFYCFRAMDEKLQRDLADIWRR